MKHKRSRKIAKSSERIVIIEGEIKELFERVENIERLIREDREDQLKKMEAELNYAKLHLASNGVGWGWMI